MVSLTSMSPSALESFLTVMNALKEMATSILDNNEITFSIEEGSALGAVKGNGNGMRVLYSEIDSAMNGKCDDKNFTTQLRIVQKQLKKENLQYNFNFIDSGNKIELHDRLINGRAIAKQRRPKSDFSYKLKIINGYFNQIGGKDPNYHFDYGNGEKLTIECSVEQAKSINQHIYSNVNSLLISKEWKSNDKKDELTHRLILDSKTLKPIKYFLNEYNNEKDLIEKLSLIHDFIDEVFKNNSDKFVILKTLLIAFNNKIFHLSELKTLLVISKPFKENNIIKKPRKELFETYSKMRNQ